MAEIKPFKSVHYNYKFANELPNLITPPYDIISPDEQEAFYKADPHNIIRLVLGKQLPDDSGADNKYTRAGSTLDDWLSKEVLVRDNAPSLIIYQMEFQQPDGSVKTIDGIIALVKADDYGPGKVLPHEKTYKGPKIDQLNLIKACKANFTPIHSLFDDERNEVLEQYRPTMEQKPDQEVADSDGTVHRTWALTDKEAIANVLSILQPKSLFIADGHHRYETALAYKREVIESGSAKPGGPHEYVMMYLTSMSHPGLIILPAHRMVKNLADIDLGRIEKSLSPYFDIEELCFSDDNRSETAATLVNRIKSYSGRGGKFGMVVQGESCFRLLRIKDFETIDKLMNPEVPSSLRGLDVTILREIIMNHGLGMDPENSEGLIEYTPSITEAMNKARNGEVQISFILNPTRVDQMRVAAELGHKLPHKSTYFYPKLSSGLALNVFERE